jgi:hypothetical protein
MSEKIIEELELLRKYLAAYVRNNAYDEKMTEILYEKLRHLLQNSVDIRNALSEIYYSPIINNEKYYWYADCATDGIHDFGSKSQEIKKIFDKIILAVKNPSLVLILNNDIAPDQHIQSTDREGKRCSEGSKGGKREGTS